METEVQAFLASYTPEVRDLAWKLRALVFEVIPHVQELVDASDMMIGYGLNSKWADIICVIAPYTSHVILMFGKGGELRDPEGMLKGTEKHVRYIKIVEASDIEDPEVRTLLENAVAAQQS
ncbi:MAG TPA: DUF1801 domain-containing protein [Ktedonobacteraceae bacterium]|nr:DUF1801 domain-containing protein [Ktedonobacteraceae bacterium]